LAGAEARLAIHRADTTEELNGAAAVTADRHPSAERSHRIAGGLPRRGAARSCRRWTFQSGCSSFGQLRPRRAHPGHPTRWNSTSEADVPSNALKARMGGFAMVRCRASTR